MSWLLNSWSKALRLASLLLAFILIFLIGCASEDEEQINNDNAATLEVVAQSQTPDESALNTSVPTFTSVPPSATPSPTLTATTTNTSTPRPTDTSTTTPTATITNTPEPTSTNTPQPTATVPPPTQLPATESPVQPSATSPPETVPTVPPEPVLGVNLIPNGSFEEGHYNQNGVAELQVPNKWRVEWDEGPTGVGNAAWDVYVRPEIVVLSTAFLPPEEHGMFIFNGQHTVKVFKGQGAVSVRLLTDVTLEPGTYIIESKMFADIVERWENGVKVWAQDPYAAEFRFIVGNGGTFWIPQKFGQINVNNFTFTADTLQTITMGVAMRGRYAIANNGWFVDDLSLRRIE